MVIFCKQNLFSIKKIVNKNLFSKKIGHSFELKNCQGTETLLTAKSVAVLVWLYKFGLSGAAISL